MIQQIVLKNYKAFDFSISVQAQPKATDSQDNSN